MASLIFRVESLVGAQMVNSAFCHLVQTDFCAKMHLSLSESCSGKAASHGAGACVTLTLIVIIFSFFLDKINKMS